MASGRGPALTWARAAWAIWGVAFLYLIALVGQQLADAAGDLGGERELFGLDKARG